MARKKKKETPMAIEEQQTTFSDVSLDELLEEGEGDIENVYDADNKTDCGEQELHND